MSTVNASVGCSTPGSILLVADASCPQVAALLRGARGPGSPYPAEQHPLVGISSALRSQRAAGLAVRTLHLIAHGRPGAFRIGDQWIDAEALKAHANDLVRWGVETIALWSCHVGADAGFVALLEELSGARVLASAAWLGRDGANDQLWLGPWQLSDVVDPSAWPAQFRLEDFDDELTGSSQPDQLNASADDLSGGQGDDALDGGAGDDVLGGGSGDDDLDGGEGSDDLDGGTGIDAIDGGAGADELSSGQGDDALDGGTGDDSLTGGDGRDDFELSDGNDVILDFEDSTDVISVRSYKDLSLEQDGDDVLIIRGDEQTRVLNSTVDAVADSLVRIDARLENSPLTDSQRDDLRAAFRRLLTGKAVDAGAIGDELSKDQKKGLLRSLRSVMKREPLVSDDALSQFSDEQKEALITEVKRLLNGREISAGQLGAIFSSEEKEALKDYLAGMSVAAYGEKESCSVDLLAGDGFVGQQGQNNNKLNNAQRFADLEIESIRIQSDLEPVLGEGPGQGQGNDYLATVEIKRKDSDPLTLESARISWEDQKKNTSVGIHIASATPEEKEGFSALFPELGFEADQLNLFLPDSDLGEPFDSYLDNQGNISGAANPPDDFDYICNKFTPSKVRGGTPYIREDGVICTKESSIGYVGNIEDNSGFRLQENWSMFGDSLDDNEYPYQSVENELGIGSIEIRPYQKGDKDSWTSIASGNSIPVELDLKYSGLEESQYILRGLINKKGKDSGAGNSLAQTRWWYFDFYQAVDKFTSAILSAGSQINISGNGLSPGFPAPIHQSHNH